VFYTKHSYLIARGAKPEHITKAQLLGLRLAYAGGYDVTGKWVLMNERNMYATYGAIFFETPDIAIEYYIKPGNRAG
jgi:hypothetical protein